VPVLCRRGLCSGRAELLDAFFDVIVQLPWTPHLEFGGRPASVAGESVTPGEQVGFDRDAVLFERADDSERAHGGVGAALTVAAVAVVAESGQGAEVALYGIVVQGQKGVVEEADQALPVIFQAFEGNGATTNGSAEVVSWSLSRESAAPSLSAAAGPDQPQRQAAAFCR
jgi:hypothetical protein